MNAKEIATRWFPFNDQSAAALEKDITEANAELQQEVERLKSSFTATKLNCKCDDSVGFLCDLHAAEKQRHEVTEWLRERYDNCVRIAAQKQGEDKAGWLDDAVYFEMTIRLLEVVGK